MKLDKMDLADILEMKMEEIKAEMAEYWIKVFDMTEQEKQKLYDLGITYKALEEEWKYHVGGF